MATRLARQRYLYEPGKRFEFLLTEAVLRFLITPPDVMRGQLDRLQNRYKDTPQGVNPF